jgi:hypothetical protein
LNIFAKEIAMSASANPAVNEKLKSLALDLTQTFPRSPRATLAGYIVAARVLDKCRATLNGTNGEYNFDCPMDHYFLDFAGIKSEDFKAFVATGASDEEVAEWIQQHATQKDREEIILWNNQWRYKTLKETEPRMQVFMEDYIQKYLPENSIIIHLFDIFDIEEKRM